MAHAQKEVENAAGNVKPIYRKLMGPTLEPPKKRLKDVEKEEGGELVLEERKAGWRERELTKECVKFMLQLLSLELGQSVRFAFMLNVPHDDDGPLVKLGPSK